KNVRIVPIYANMPITVTTKIITMNSNMHDVIDKFSRHFSLQERNRILFERMIKAKSLQPTMTLSKLIAFVLAISVHGMTLIFFFAGLWLVLTGLFGGGVRLLCFGPIALLLWSIAWQVRPLFNQKPKTVLTRESFPATFHLADQVAQALDVPPVDFIQITP